jgi:hypothetical protein
MRWLRLIWLCDHSLASGFPDIWGKFCFLFISVMVCNILKELKQRSWIGMAFWKVMESCFKDSDYQDQYILELRSQRYTGTIIWMDLDCDPEFFYQRLVKEIRSIKYIQVVKLIQHGNIEAFPQVCNKLYRMWGICATTYLFKGTSSFFGAS